MAPKPTKQSQLSDVSDNGVVVFASFATNLVPGDTNGFWDAFAHRIGNGETRRVSVSSAGAQGNNHSGIFGVPTISANGDRIAFDSLASNLVAGDSNANLDTFLRDRSSQTTRRVSVRFDGTQGNTAAAGGHVTSNGKLVAFLSNSTNLVGGDSNGFVDIIHPRPHQLTRTRPTKGPRRTGGLCSFTCVVRCVLNLPLAGESVTRSPFAAISGGSLQW